MSEKLKPCPFCGGEAESTKDGRCWQIECTEIGCPVGPSTYWYNTEEEAIKAWNTRWSYYGDTIECYECAIGGKEAAQRSVEENIRAQGYVKERTCHNVNDDRFSFECSECGDWDDIQFNRYCPHCGAKVVER